MEKKRGLKRKAEKDLEVEKEESTNTKKGKKNNNDKSPGRNKKDKTEEVQTAKKEEAQKKEETQKKEEAEKKTTAAKGKQATLDLFKINIKTTIDKDFEKFPEVPKNSNLKICSWNVNGLRAVINKGSIEKFIKTDNPDIFCLNETKIDITALKKDKHDKLYSEDYLSFWNCCKVKSGYSGVAIFTKYRPVNVTYGIGQEAHDDEGRVLTVEFADFFLVSVYVPNAGEGLKRLNYRVKEWDVAFGDYLNGLKAKKDLILCGDLNVAHKDIDIYEPKGHLKSPGFTPEERESFTKFLEFGYLDSFRHLYPKEVKFSYFTARQKTYKDQNKGWRLDYFVINQKAVERLVDSEILYDFEGSDHIPIRLTWKV